MSERGSHVIWYFDEKSRHTENVVCSDAAVASILWDRLRASGKTMMNERPERKRVYTGLKGGERPITQDDLDQWIPE